MTDSSIKSLYKTNEIFFQYPVSDYEQSISFYQKLGLQPTSFSHANSYQDVGIFEFDLPVPGAVLSLAKVSTGPLQPLDAIALNVSDLEAFKMKLDELDIVSTEINDVPNVLSFLKFSDPDGNRITAVSEPRVTS